MVTSLEFNPIRCATMLSHFGQTHNGSVTIHFFLCGSTATSSATGAYIAVPGRFGEIKEPAFRNEKWTTKKPSFVPSGKLKRCNKISDM